MAPIDKQIGDLKNNQQVYLLLFVTAFYKKTRKIRLKWVKTVQKEGEKVLKQAKNTVKTAKNNENKQNHS